MTTEILIGDCIESMKSLPSGSISACVTSPPYFGLRRYLPEDHPDSDKEVGLEQTPEEFVQKMVEVFREVKRVLRDDGTCWVNLGDSYNANQGSGFDTNQDGGIRKSMAASPKVSSGGLPPKNLLGIPWRVAFALQADGWYLRQDIIWHKPNPMPESVTDRCTKSHEYVFLLTKSARYWMDMDAIRQKPTGRTDPIRSFSRGSIGNHTPNYQLDASVGANKRSVWTVSTQSYSGAHFAVFPAKLIEPMILAGCPAKRCPVCGAGWVRVVEKESRQGQKEWSGADRKNGCQAGGGHKGRTGEWISSSQTIGFQPSCQCNAPDHVPGTVIDPFGGSGTTAYVANAYGRNAILCELNPEYKPLILERLGMPYEVEQEERKPQQQEMF